MVALEGLAPLALAHLVELLVALDAVREAVGVVRYRRAGRVLELLEVDVVRGALIGVLWDGLVGGGTRWRSDARKTVWCPSGGPRGCGPR